MYTQKDDIDALIKKMRLVREEESVYYYVDEEAGQPWILTVFWSEQLEKDVFLLKQNDIDSSELVALITTAILEEDELDTIAALSLELYHKAGFVKEYRLFLLEQFEELAGKKRVNKGMGERVNLCVYETRLYDSTNREGVVGKHHNQVMSDADFYRNIAERAKKLLNKKV